MSSPGTRVRVVSPKSAHCGSDATIRVPPDDRGRVVVDVDGTGLLTELDEQDVVEVAGER